VSGDTPTTLHQTPSGYFIVKKSKSPEPASFWTRAGRAGKLVVAQGLDGLL
jgi:hypothetical protein